MMGIKTETRLEISQPVSIGDRKVFVVSCVIVVTNKDGAKIFAGLVSPTSIIIEDRDSKYGFSLPGGKILDVDRLFLENPSLEKQYSRMH